MSDKQLLEYLADKPDLGGVVIEKIHYEDFAKLEYINLTMRMGIDRVTTNELHKHNFYLSRSWIQDNTIRYEFMRWK